MATFGTNTHFFFFLFPFVFLSCITSSITIHNSQSIENSCLNVTGLLSRSCSVLSALGERSNPNRTLARISVSASGNHIYSDYVDLYEWAKSTQDPIARGVMGECLRFIADAYQSLNSVEYENGDIVLNDAVVKVAQAIASVQQCVDSIKYYLGERPAPYHLDKYEKTFDLLLLTNVIVTVALR